MDKQIIEVIDNSFKEPQPISGGNRFEQHVNLQVQNEIDNTIGNFDVNVVQNNINQESQKLLANVIPPGFILLQEAANYFCNQFQGKCQDPHFKTQIINTIRASFYSGRAGMYFNDITGKGESVVLGEINYNASGEMIDAKYSLANVYLNGVMKDKDKVQIKAYYSIPQSKIKNLSLFKWGSEGWSAWVRLLPYINFQHMLLKMLVSSSLALQKKFLYVVNDPNASKDEMKAYFDVNNPFLIKAGFASEMNNRFEELKVGSSNNELINFYNEMMSIINRQIGKRENIDYKKERNITTEVQASQENYDIVFNDVNKQFCIFVDILNEIVKTVGVGDNVEVVNIDIIDTKDNVRDLKNEGETNDI